MPYFRSAAHLKIQLKEGADSSQIKVFVNSRAAGSFVAGRKNYRIIF